MMQGAWQGGAGSSSERWRRPANGSSRSAGPPGGRPLCSHFRRGQCHFGTSCRFSHDPAEHAAAALPFQDRERVQSQANMNAAASAAAAAAAAKESCPAATPWRFRVLSYNILADHLAHEHAAELYSSAPHFSLRWSYRSGLILREILHHRPDVVCLQEVDHFRQMQEELQPHGYEGMYTKRTGDRRDGLAIFWRTDSVRPVKQRTICFRDYGLKDNVAQLVAFQPLTGGAAAAHSQTSSEGSASSLLGQKRRQAELGASSRAGAGAPTHLRFSDSSSESEGEGDGALQRAPSAKRRGFVPSAAAAAALEACSIQDAVPGRPSSSVAAAAAAVAAAAGRSQSGSEWMGIEVEEATQPADEDAEAAAAAVRPCLPSLVVANIHVLFNPKRGDMKMGQVRIFLEHVDSLCLQQQKSSGARAAAIVCGDFNSAAGSPIYEFVRNGQLELPLYDRRYMSGQVELSGRNWRALQQAFLAAQRQRQQWDQQQQVWQHGGNGVSSHDAWPGQPPAMALDAAVETLASSSTSHQQQPWPVPQYAPPEPYPTGRSNGSRRSLRPWSAEDVRLAAGSSGSSSSSSGPPMARHPLQLESTYRAVTGREAAYSTCHDKFIGCVDYMWFTPGGSEAAPWRLLPVATLCPPPAETLHCALPSPAWPSDHISLVCDYALLPGVVAAQRERRSQRKKAVAHL
ncbi:hypothetical protein ABPG75_009827 [Micractinium tetrahymenae]